jgi:DNA repair protein RadC
MFPMGVKAASDLELLTAVIGRGAQRALEVFGSMRALAKASDEELAAAGITAKKVAAVRAAIEAGARALDPIAPGALFSGPFEVAEHYRAKLANSDVEEFWVMFVNCRNRMISEQMIGRGTATGVEVHPREVMRAAIKAGAAGIILAHNHPSGDPTPSKQDKVLTDRLRAVGELCGIKVLDHIVLSTTGFAQVD